MKPPPLVGKDSSKSSRLEVLRESSLRKTPFSKGRKGGGRQKLAGPFLSRWHIWPSMAEKNGKREKFLKPDRGGIDLFREEKGIRRSGKKEEMEKLDRCGC